MPVLMKAGHDCYFEPGYGWRCYGNCIACCKTRAEKEKAMETKMIKQNDLSEECWAVQIWGTEKCHTCEYRDTDDCGGRSILLTGENKLGIKIGPKGMEKS